MQPDSAKLRHADGDGQHHRYFVPTVRFSHCPDAKIYVNTIINHPCSSPPSENASTKKKDHDNSKPSSGDKKIMKKISNTHSIDLHEGGRVEIRCDSKEDANLPVISVEIQKLSPDEIQKLSSEGTSEIKPMIYVTTVHQNNVSGKEIKVEAKPRAIDHIIGADNVILNSTGTINVGPGAGGDNSGPKAGCILITKNN